MSKKVKILATILVIASILTTIISNLAIAKSSINSDITAQNNYIKNQELTYRKEENGETLISGFKIEETISEILEGRFGIDYEIKIKNNEGKDITNELDQKIATGYKIELYEKTEKIEEDKKEEENSQDEEISEKTYTVVIYGDTNGDGKVGAVDALAIVKNKIGKEQFKNIENEEAGRIKQDTRKAKITPKADDALYIIKNKLEPENYEINQKMPENETEEKIENGNNIEGKVNGTLTGGKYNYNNPVIPVGFKTVDTEIATWKTKDEKTIKDWNKGLVIEDEKGNQFVWVPACLPEEADELEERITKYEKSISEENNQTIIKLEDLKEDTTPSRIENETEQIKTYKGFYISKYEAGIPEEMQTAIKTATKQARNVTGTPIIKKNKTNWNYIDYTNAKQNAEKMYQTQNVQSGLPSGTQWDVLIKWQENKKTEKPVISELQEWTNETNEPYKITRGEIGKEIPSAYRQKTLPEETNNNLGYRIVLYIQETKIPAEIEEQITITLNSETPRNTLKTGIQNGVNAGPIQVTINYGETELQKQYKKETDAEWTTIEENKTTIEITENETILARYTDGTNNYKTTTKTIQNVDNIEPTIKTNNITIYGTTITIEATAKDEANKGAHPNIAGISKIQYSTDGKNYQSENELEIKEAGNYTIYTKAIDKAGNQTIEQKQITINEYKITFNPNGGEITKENKNVIQNTPYGEMPEPIKEGYTFTGWYTDKIEGTLITKDTIANIEKNQTLYAHWTPNQYTLTIKHYLENPNDTGYTLNKTTTANIIYGTEINLENHKTNIENETNSNIGTYKEGRLEENGTIAENTIMGTKTTIHLYYTRNTHTLTLNKGNYIKETIGEGQYKIGQTIEIDAKLTENETGYTNKWVNWTSNNTQLLPNNNTQKLKTTMPAGDITLTANAIKTPNTYTVNFNPNEGTLEKNKTTKEVTYDAQYQELPTPSKEGHTFIGWYTEKEEGTQITNETIVKTPNNHTLYAHWQINNYTLTIKHYLENPNDTNYTLNKTTTQQNITYKTPIQLSNYKTEIENGEYKEGKLTKEGTPIETTQMGTETTIHLYYTRNKYTLTLNTGENIQTVTGTGTYKIGETVEINAEIKENETGYTNTWKNWQSNNQELLENQQLQKTKITMPKGNITLTANAIKTPNTYTINFDPNEGTLNTIKNKTITYEKTYEELPEPERTGYTFIGWYTEQTQGELITQNTKVTNTQEHTLYAHWQKNDYTLTIKHYLENPNDKNYTLEKTTQETVTYKTPIQLANYKTEIQNGEYKEGKLEENGTIAETTQMGTETTIHLYYTRNKYTLTLNTGENIETVTGEGLYKVGEIVEIDANVEPNEEGYTNKWKNWTSNKIQDINQKQTNITMPGENITLTANATKTPNTYTVNFNSNTGTLIEKNKEVTYDAKYGNLPTPIKKGHTFIGWYTEKETGEKITEDSTVKTSQNHTIYAHWEANNYILTIKHYLENPDNENYTLKTTTTTNITYGTEINLEQYKTNITDETNQTIGTYKQGKLTENGTKAETTTMETNTIIHLYYTRNKYTLTLEKGDNIETITGEGQYKVGQTIEITAELKQITGYTTSWVGWTNDNITTIQNTGTQNLTLTMPATNVTLTANATKTPNTYQVTFNLNSGNTVEPTRKLVTYDAQYGELPIPTKTGYTFTGWYTDKTQETEEIKITETTTVKTAEDHEIYAHWEANKYQVTFNLNSGDTVEPTRKLVTYDAQYGELPTPTKTGYTFAGWYTDKTQETEETKITEATIIKTAEDHEIYAHWTPNIYTINLNNQSATTAGTTEIFEKYETGIYKESACTTLLTTENSNKIDLPLKTGHTFGGYYTQENGEGELIITAKGKITNDLTTTKYLNHTTLYAKWTANPYTLTVRHYLENSNSTGYIYQTGKDKTYTVTYGTPITIDDEKITIESGEYSHITIENAGYNHASTTLNGTSLTSTTMGIDTIIYLYYNLDRYTVTYNLNGGTGAPGNQTKVYGINLTLSETVPKKENHYFLYWVTTDGEQYNPGDEFTINSNTTLIATWAEYAGTIYFTNGTENNTNLGIEMINKGIYNTNNTWSLTNGSEKYPDIENYLSTEIPSGCTIYLSDLNNANVYFNGQLISGNTYRTTESGTLRIGIGNGTNNAGSACVKKIVASNGRLYKLKISETPIQLFNYGLLGTTPYGLEQRWLIGQFPGKCTINMKLEAGWAYGASGNVRVYLNNTEIGSAIPQANSGAGGSESKDIMYMTDNIGGYMIMNSNKTDGTGPPGYGDTGYGHYHGHALVQILDIVDKSGNTFIVK